MRDNTHLITERQRRAVNEFSKYLERYEGYGECAVQFLRERMVLNFVVTNAEFSGTPIACSDRLRDELNEANEFFHGWHAYTAARN